MIRKFEIRNEKYNGELEAYLTYNTETDEYKMRLLEDYSGKHPDITFKELHKQGVVEVPDHITRNWVEHRVIPPNRQGLQGILEEMGMTEYNVFDLLLYNSARNQMDYSYIVEV